MKKNKLSFTHQGIGFFIKYQEVGMLIALIRVLCGIESREIFVNIGCNKGEAAKGYLVTLRKILDQFMPGRCSGEFYKKSELFRGLLVDPNPSSEVQSSLTILCEEYPQIKYLRMGVGSKVEVSNVFVSERARAGVDGSHEWVITRPVNSERDSSLDNAILIDRFDNLWHQNYDISLIPGYMRIMTNGNDLDVVKSCGSLIKSIKVISLALNGIAYNFREIFVFLRSNDFALLRIAPQGFIVVESEGSIIDACPVYRSYIAIKNDILRQII